MRHFPFMDVSKFQIIKEKPIDKYIVWNMHEFIEKYIDSSNKQELVNSLVELMEKADNVTSDMEWCISSDTCVATTDIRNHQINIDWFLADVWRFIITKSRNNKRGQASYSSWFDKEELENGKYRFVSNIGYNNSQWFDLTEEKKKPEPMIETEEMAEIEDKILEEGTSEESRPVGSVLNEQALKLGQVLQDYFVPSTESIEKEILAKQKCEPQGAIYTSKYKEGELFTLLNNGDIEPVQIDDAFSFEDICGDDYFEFTEMCYFASTFGVDMKRCIEVKIPMKGYTIIGRTSIENWNSKSYLNNLVCAGKGRCNGIFTIVGKNDDMIIVQFIYLRR